MLGLITELLYLIDNLNPQIFHKLTTQCACFDQLLKGDLNQQGNLVSSTRNPPQSTISSTITESTSKMKFRMQRVLKFYPIN